MATLRTNSTGTVSVLFRHGRKQTSKTFTTPAAAEKFRTLVDLLGADKALSTLAAPVAGMTLDQLAEKFFDWKAGQIEARTVKDYRRDYANWIAPKLGGRPAESIDEADVQTLVDGWRDRLDPKSIADRHAILFGIYKFGSARSRRLVTGNPCLETQLPRRKKKAPKGFTIPEWDAMHEWGARHEPDADDLLLLIASTGWRFSEATALMGAAVDDRGDVEVTPGVWVPWLFVGVVGVHRRDEDDRVVFVEGEAKSAAGLRWINLPPEAAYMVRRRMVGKGPRDLVFTSPTGKQWRSNNFLDREFQRILDGAGIPKVKGMGPHYLRHTHVMLCDRAGVSTAKTQRRIGHEHISTTYDVYGGQIGNSLTPAELVALGELLQPKPAAIAVVPGEVVREISPARPADAP